MQLSSLQAISPIDGRYAALTEALRPYFSEQALMRYRVEVEVEYFLALCRHPLPELATFPLEQATALRAIYFSRNDRAAERIKALEKTINHDVKAVEYYVKEELDRLGLAAYREFVHFGLTSQDINNTAYPMLLRDFLEQQYKPQMDALLQALQAQVELWCDVAMPAHTHGQPASPTRLGKEINVFVVRLQTQLNDLAQIKHRAKFGGAVGNFNAHRTAYPSVDWLAFADRFIEELGLTRSHPTTQIEHYDGLAALFDNLKRINTILIDYSRDMWQYIAMSYFRQQIKEEEIGSSTMPHKVNPIDFENAEGNLGVANTLLEYFSAKLPISRLQRDLTDSTVMRNVGVPLAHTCIALSGLQRGIAKLALNADALRTALDDNWAVIAEGIQTVLRRASYPHPYEALKELTRINRPLTRQDMQDFIRSLEVSPALQEELLAITPFNYTGL